VIQYTIIECRWYGGSRSKIETSYVSLSNARFMHSLWAFPNLGVVGDVNERFVP